MTPRAPLACATALAALFAMALAEQLCETTQFGNESQVRVSRPVRRVEPGMFTLEINEPDVCPESEAVGLKVTACDAEEAPRVLLLDAARGMVVRAGGLAGAAYVISTVYCAEPDDAAPESTEAPATDTSISTATTLPLQLMSISIPDSLPLSEVEPPSVPNSSTNEYLPPVRLESRFSSIDQSNGPPISTSLSSRLKDQWKEHAEPSLGQLKSQSFPEGTSSWLQESEQSLLDKDKHKPSIFDSYSKLINSFPKSSSSSLAKRLIDLRPKQPHKGLENRAPAWKRRPTRRPSSPWLKLRSLPDGETRKSIPRSRYRALNAFTDYNDPWTPYEDDPLSLNWTDEPIDSNPWYTEGDPQSPYTNNFPWRIKPPKTHNWNERPHPPLHHKRPSPSAIKHNSKKQSRFVPPIHEEDPALLLEWKENRPRSKRPALPKLLLLLQDQDHQAPVKRKCSAHSVEDTGPWWSTQPYKNIEDEGIPWQPDYPADYTADDGDARSYSLGNYIDDRIQQPHVAPAKKRAPTRPPRHRATPPASLVDAQLVPHASQKPPPSSKASPYESYFYYTPTPLTERPLLTSTARNSLPWIKNSNAMPLKSPMKLKQPSLKKLSEKSNHHYPPDRNYPSEHRYPSKPLVPVETNYPPEIHNPSNHHYPPDRNYPSDHRFPSKPLVLAETNYPPETYNPSHLQSNPFSGAENYFPSEPHLPSGSHFPPETNYPSEPYYPSESGNISSEPYDPSESGNVPSEPHYSLEPHYLSEPDYPLEHHYPSGPTFTSEPDYPSEPYYSSELGNVPTEPHFLSEPQYPLDHHYPPGPHFPSGPHFLSKPGYPSEPYYPSVSENVPLEPHYPPEPHYPSEHHYPSEPDYQSQYLQSSAPWNFLSELLLSHPSFRDSTHVIRIR